MDILEHYPVASFGAVEKLPFGWFFLSLAHGDIDESPVVGRDVELGGDFFHIWRGVDAWEKNEENGYSFGRLGEGFDHIEGRLFDESFAHFFGHEHG